MKHLISNYWCIELEPAAFDPWIMERYEDSALGYYIPNKTFGEEKLMWSESIKLSDKPNQYSIVGWSDEIGEEQAAKMVQSFPDEYVDLWIDYYESSKWASAARQSLNILLKSKGITNRALIIKKEV